MSIEVIDNKKMGMSDKHFKKLATYIESSLGIKMPDSKRIMLESRLQKRLRLLSINSYDDYIDMVLDKESDELVNMIDVITTNKTDFFREPDHFDYLTKRILPAMLGNNSSYKSCTFWSAGCATGEEPYTLAMVLEEYKSNHRNFDYKIIASDISTRALNYALNATYDIDKVIPVPETYVKKYLLRSKDSEKKIVRIKKELRNKIDFLRINFMDNTYPFDGFFDMIFCRNVIIYFDRETQERILGNMCRYLRKGGYFILGHSETLTGMDLPLRGLAPTIYERL